MTDAVPVISNEQIKALMRRHHIWVEVGELYEKGLPPRELREVQAEEHQFEAFVQDLIALASSPDLQSEIRHSGKSLDHWQLAPVVPPLSWCVDFMCVAFRNAEFKKGSDVDSEDVALGYRMAMQKLALPSKER